MLYGCRCGIVDNPNYLMTSTDMRLFWLSLSTIKCNRVPFIHICEWQRCSPSLGYIGSSSWIVPFATIEVGCVLMIYLFSIFFWSDSESGFDSLSLTSSTNDFFEWHSLVLCQWILWKSHHFLVSFFFFPLPFFSYVLEWFSGGCWLGPFFPCFGFSGICRPELLFFLVPKFLLDFNCISIRSTEWWDIQKINFSLDVSV